jgi:hypothetical protein
VAEFLKTEVKLGGFLASLKQFEKFVTTDVAYTGAATMGRVIYEEVKLNTSKVDSPGAPDGLPGMLTGNLHRSIFWAKRKSESTDSRAVYIVSFRHKGSAGGGGNHGFMVEFGYIQKYKVIRLKNGEWRTLKNVPLAVPKKIAPRPFMRPSLSRMPYAAQLALKNMTDKFKQNIGV